MIKYPLIKMKEIEVDELTRKEIIQGGIAGGIVTTSAMLLSASGLRRAPGELSLTDFIKDGAIVLNSENPFKTRRMLSDIKRYRESLGLYDLPTNFEDNYHEELKWPRKCPDFIKDVPETIESYSNFTEDMVRSVLGENGSHLIKGIKTDPNNPFGVNFHVRDRMITIPTNSHNIPMEGQYLHYFFHESLGHGTDPIYGSVESIGSLYPPEVLLKVEHGKWKALSKMFDVEEDKFAYPIGKLYRKAGYIFANYYVQTDLSNIVDFTGQHHVMDVLKEVADEHSSTTEELKFNKSVSTSIGEKLITRQRNHEINFTGPMQEFYQKILEQTVLTEMYAEMASVVILEPDTLSDHPEISEGFEEIFSAIRGEDITLDEIREQVSVVISKNGKRNSEEQALLKSIETNSPPQEFETIEPEEVEQAVIEETDFRKKENAFTLFVRDGLHVEYPYLPEEKRDLIGPYSRAVATIVNKNQEILWASPGFDPWLHYWDIVDIEEAARTDFIRELIQNPEAISQYSDLIIHNTKILEGFINSPAFDTLKDIPFE